MLSLPISSCLLLLVLAVGAFSHSVSMGSCKTVQPMEGFKPEKIEGTWFVMQIFGHQSKCATLTYKQNSPSELSVTEGMEFYILDKINVEYEHANTGVLTIEDPSVPSKMTVRWPDNIAGSATYYIVDTDYSNYLLIIECQKLFLFARTNAIIASRNTTLSKDIVNKLKRDVDNIGLNFLEFHPMDHSKCLPQGTAGVSNDSVIGDTIKKNVFNMLANVV